MKKFGTPNGAAPGSENENVGFADVGTPPLPRILVGLLAGFDPLPELLELDLEGFEPLDPLELFGLLGCEEGFCCWGWPPGFGGGLLLPVLVEPVSLPVPVPVPVPVGVDLVGGGGGVVAVGAQDSATPTTPTFTGNEIADSGVPGGTFTVNDKCPPPISVTVMTH